VAGRLPNGAKEVQRGALLELDVHLTFAETTVHLKKGHFPQIKLHLQGNKSTNMNFIRTGGQKMQLTLSSLNQT